MNIERAITERVFREGFIPNPKARLWEQVREVMRSKHYALRTEETYWHWIRRYILFHGKRHPREMGQPEIVAFLTDRAVRQHVAASVRHWARQWPGVKFVTRRQ